MFSQLTENWWTRRVIQKRKGLEIEKSWRQQSFLIIMHTKSLPAISQELVRSNLSLKCWKLEVLANIFWFRKVRCWCGSEKVGVELHERHPSNLPLTKFATRNWYFHCEDGNVDPWWSLQQLSGLHICATMYFQFDLENLVRVTESHCWTVFVSGRSRIMPNQILIHLTGMLPFWFLASTFMLLIREEERFK